MQYVSSGYLWDQKAKPGARGLRTPLATPLLPTSEKEGRQTCQPRVAALGRLSLNFEGEILGFLNPLFSHPSERSLNSSFTRSSEVEDGTCFSPSCPGKQKNRLWLLTLSTERASPVRRQCPCLRTQPSLLGSDGPCPSPNSLC